MKMKDVFTLPVRAAYTIETNGDGEDWQEYYFAKKDSNIGAFKYPNTVKEVYDAACFAINNHDRLTEENAKLRDALQWTHEKLTEEGKRYGASTKRAEISKLLNQSKDQSNEK